MNVTFAIRADDTPLRAAIQRLVDLLLTRDISPELRENMLANLNRAFEKPDTGVYEIADGRTAVPGEIRLEIQPGRLIRDAIAALRDLPAASAAA